MIDVVPPRPERLAAPVPGPPRAPLGAGPGAGETPPEQPRAAGRAVRALELILNYHCNAACPHCNPPPEDPSGTMRPAQVYAALARGRRAGVRAVTFGGGEPTLRRELPAFVRRARELGYDTVGLKTNGLVLGAPGAARRLADLGLTHAHLSWWGATAAAHDRVARVPGAARLRDRAAAQLAEAGVALEAEVLLTTETLAGLEALAAAIVAAGLRTLNFWLLSLFALPEGRFEGALPRLEDAGPALVRLFDRYPAAEGYRLGTFHVPRCFLGPHQDRFLDLAERDLLVITPEGSFRGEQSPYETGTLLETCADCRHARRCRGIRHDYLRAHGAPAVLPVFAAPLPDAPDESQRAGPFSDLLERYAEGAVAVAHVCNETCVFCTGFDRTPRPFEELQRAVEGHDDLFLSGGEPTLLPRLPELIAHARAHGARHVTLVTNGVRLADRACAAAIAAAGVDCFLFNLPSHREALLEELVARPGSFGDKLRALDVLAELGLASRVRLVHVIIEPTYRELPDFARFVAARLPFVQGVELKLAQCFDRPTANAPLIPRLTELEAPLHEAIRVLEAAGMRAVPNGVPACFLGAFRDRAMEAELARAGRALTGRRLLAVCDTCPDRPACLGPRADYVALHGAGEFTARRGSLAPGTVGADWSRRQCARVLTGAARGERDRALAALENWLGVHGLAELAARALPPAPALAPDLVHRGLKPAERLALAAGLKPVTKFEDLPLAEAETLAAALAGRFQVVRTDGHEKDALHLDARAPDAGTPDGGTRPRYATLYVSRGAQAREAAALERADPHGNAARVGRLLGYPDCCVERFVATQERVRSAGGELNEALYRDLSLERSPEHGAGTAGRRGPAPWETNFLSNHSLLSHYPCSYRCAPSLGYARRVLEAAAAQEPGARARLEGALRRPYLFARLAAFAAFDGTVRDGVLHYRGFAFNEDGDATLHPIGALLRATLGRALAAGEALRVAGRADSGDQRFEVLAGTDTVAVLPFLRPDALVVLDHTGSGDEP